MGASVSFCGGCGGEDDSPALERWRPEPFTDCAADASATSGDRDAAGERVGGLPALALTSGQGFDPTAAATATTTGKPKPRRRSSASLQPADSSWLLRPEPWSARSDEEEERGVRREEESPLPQTPPLALQRGTTGTAQLLTPLHMLELRRAVPRSLRHCTWRLAFSLGRKGQEASLRGLNKALSGSTAVVLAILINDGSLLGAVLSCPGAGWKDDGRPFGSDESFLYSLPPCAPSKLVRAKSAKRAGSNSGSAQERRSRGMRHRRSTTDRIRNILPRAAIYPARPVADGVGDAKKVFARASDKHLCFGEHGLWLDADLLQGGSQPCCTYLQPLAHKEQELRKQRDGIDGPCGRGEGLCKLGSFFDVLAVEAWSLSGHQERAASSLLSF